jgi:hypothetical protein
MSKMGWEAAKREMEMTASGRDEYIREGVYIDAISGVEVCEACDCAVENGTCLCSMRRDW